jgi:hypothetical protein
MTSIANSKQGNSPIMKKQYNAPKLTVHGDVAEITQVLGRSSRKDFVFFNGTSISDDDDQGSRDICQPKNPAPNGSNCDPNFP